MFQYHIYLLYFEILTYKLDIYLVPSYTIPGFLRLKAHLCEKYHYYILDLIIFLYLSLIL
jgi:hypothetical protein